LADRRSAGLAALHCDQSLRGFHQATMRAHLIAIGDRLPDWVQAGYS
jgi:hypothetical protein